MRSNGLRLAQLGARRGSDAGESEDGRAGAAALTWRIRGRSRRRRGFDAGESADAVAASRVRESPSAGDDPQARLARGGPVQDRRRHARGGHEAGQVSARRWRRDLRLARSDGDDEKRRGRVLRVRAREGLRGRGLAAARARQRAARLRGRARAFAARIMSPTNRGERPRPRRGYIVETDRGERPRPRRGESAERRRGDAATRIFLR